MQKPIVAIRTRVEWLAKTRIHEDANNQHAAVYPGSQDVSLAMIRRADPLASLGNNAMSLLRNIASDAMSHRCRFIETSRSKVRNIASDAISLIHAQNTVVGGGM